MKGPFLIAVGVTVIGTLAIWVSQLTEESRQNVVAEAEAERAAATDPNTPRTMAELEALMEKQRQEEEEAERRRQAAEMEGVPVIESAEPVPQLPDEYIVEMNADGSFTVADAAGKRTAYDGVAKLLELVAPGKDRRPLISLHPIKVPQAALDAAVQQLRAVCEVYVASGGDE